MQPRLANMDLRFFFWFFVFRFVCLLGFCFLAVSVIVVTHVHRFRIQGKFEGRTVFQVTVSDSSRVAGVP